MMKTLITTVVLVGGFLAGGTLSTAEAKKKKKHKHRDRYEYRHGNDYRGYDGHRSYRHRAKYRHHHGPRYYAPYYGYYDPFYAPRPGISFTIRP